MSTVAKTQTPTDAWSGRYRRMERALWDRYGLEPTERFVELSSPAVRLRIVEVGSGPPVLFVHGTAGTGPVWAPLVHELSGFRCLLLDRPGWAFSSPLDYSRRDYGSLVAEVLGETLAALGIGRASVVGASIGDLWALRLAQLDPGRVDRVALLGGGPLVSEIEVPPFIRLLASPVGALLVRLPMKAGRVRAIMRDSGHRASLDAGRIPDEFIDWRVSLARETDSMRHERDMVRAVVSGKGFRPGFVFADAEVGAVPQPTLLVYGTSDPVGSVDLWRRVVGLLPRGELHLVENGGHLPWLDEPAGVATRVGRFLAAA